MNDVTLITCTGMRAESIRRCARYVHRFDGLGSVRVQWIVVDDGDVQTFVPYVGDNATVEEKLIRPKHRWEPGKNTLALNLLAALPHVKYDSVMFIEDDDWYSPQYMSRQLELLRGASIAGERPSRYYHLPSNKWRIMRSVHASLCQTAMRASLLPLLESVCRADASFIDVSLWQRVFTTHCAFSERLDDTTHCVGMKGLPGRAGIGIGHRPELGAGWNADPGREKLREWLGNDMELYFTPRTQPKPARIRAQSLQDASVSAI